MHMDKLTQQQLIIQHFISSKKQSCIKNAQLGDIVRFPLLIYKSCQGIFIKQKQVDQIILQYFIRQLYVKDIKQLIEIGGDSENSYIRLLINSKDNIIIYLSQIVIRLLILALSIKISQKTRYILQICKYKMKKMLKQLQIQLVLNEKYSLSNLMIKEIEVIIEYFKSIQFLEDVKIIIQKCDIFQLSEWIDKQLQQRRQKFDKKFEEQAVKAKTYEKTDKKVIKKRVTISNNNELRADEKINGPQNIRLSIEPHNQNSINQNIKSQKKTLSILAKRIRQSSGPNQRSVPKLQHNFIYRSNKKIAQDDILAEYQSSPPKVEPNQKIAENIQYKQSYKIKNVLHQVDENSDSKILCKETPPRQIKSKTKLIQ